MSEGGYSIHHEAFLRVWDSGYRWLLILSIFVTESHSPLYTDTKQAFCNLQYRPGNLNIGC